MKHFLISLFCLICTISSSSSEEREDCWSFYANRKYTEFSGNFKESNDFDECRKTCFKTDNCYIVFEDSENNVCYYNVVDGEKLDEEKFVVDEKFKEYYLTDCQSNADEVNASDEGNSDAGDQEESE